MPFSGTSTGSTIIDKGKIKVPGMVFLILHYCLISTAKWCTKVNGVGAPGRAMNKG